MDAETVSEEPPAPFVDADFQSLDGFPLKRRWTDARWNVLPPEALATIRPFTPKRAAELWVWAATFLDLSKAPSQLLPSVGSFASVHRLDIPPVDADPPRQWLRARGVAGDPWVIVSWHPDTALLTRWSVFCEYWDDFCYPMGDDLVLWPPSEQWALLYWHEDELIFGTRDAVTQAEQPTALTSPPGAQ